MDHPEKIRILPPIKAFDKFIKIRRLDNTPEQPLRSTLNGLLYKLRIFQKKENDKTINDLKYYNEVIKKEPENAKAHFRLAKIYHKRGKRKKRLQSIF